METKANYIVTGLFTLAVIVGVFGFIYWFQNSGGGGERAVYRVVFAGSVSGLRTGAPVLFDGVRVGEVTALALDAHDPRKVEASISVDRAVPVRADTKVTLDFQGLTGLAEVSLAGGAADAALIAANDGGPPTIYAEPNAGADVTQAARNVLARIDGLVADNETAMRTSLRNIETVTATLAQNSDRLNKVMAGLENLTGSGDNHGEIAASRRGDPQACRQSRQTHGRDIDRARAVLEFGSQAIRGVCRRRPPHACRTAEDDQEHRPAPQPADLRALRRLVRNTIAGNRPVKLTPRCRFSLQSRRPAARRAAAHCRFRTR